MTQANKPGPACDGHLTFPTHDGWACCWHKKC